MSMTRKEAMKIIRRADDYIVVKENDGDKFFVMSSALREAVDLAVSALRTPTREQVVLCKDCRYWQGNNGGYPHPECRWAKDETPDNDDYCSFAERLEMSKNG